MNLPNKLTAARFIMAALFPILFFAVSPEAGLVLYVLAFLTDVLDGYLARKLNAITPWGQTMDPLADKVMLGITLFCFALSEWIPWWFFIVVVGKDAVMVTVGLFMYRRMDKLVQPATLIGKAATFCFMLAIVLSIPLSFFSALKISDVPLSWILFLVALGLSVIAFFRYAHVISLRVFGKRRRSKAM